MRPDSPFLNLFCGQIVHWLNPKPIWGSQGNRVDGLQGGKTMKKWVIGILLVILGVAAYYYFGVKQVADSEVTLSTSVPAAVAEPEPVPEPVRLPAEALLAEESGSGLETASPTPVEDIPLPMLMDSDPLVLDMFGGLIGESAVIQYLVSDNVISRIVATVETMGSRQIPGVVQVVQGPESEFVAIENAQPETIIRNAEGDPIPQFDINPANYRRYTPYVELLEAVDTAQLVENYRSHYSLFQEAYRQMGYTDGEFNDRLIAVIDDLLATPEVTDPVNLVKPEAFFLFADPDLESRSAGQKILLRMGTANAARVRSILAGIRASL
jgi:hypothetical protein